MGSQIINESGIEIMYGKTDKTRDRSLKIDRVIDDYLPGAYDKSRVEATVVRESGEKSKHQVNVFIKEVDVDDDLIGGETEEQTDAERYVERWKFLRKIGIPTITSMRVIDDDKVLMGDMTADGSGFIDKETYYESSHKYRKLSRAENLFLDIDPKRIKREVEIILRTAWNNGILLPSDREEFSILVHPDGTWQVLVVDLMCLRRKELGDTELDLESKRKELFTRIDEIRDKLLGWKRKGG